MEKESFVLILGHGRSGTSAIRAFLNLSPEINIAFEENQMILQDENPKIYSGDDKFSWNLDLAQREIPNEYNGNKIILGPYYIPAERIVQCIEKKKVIVHKNFNNLIVLFPNRKKEDVIASIMNRRKGTTKKWATENWSKNEDVLIELKKYFVNHLSFDFYDFVLREKVREEVFDFIGARYQKEWINQTIKTVGYGDYKLDFTRVKNFSQPKSSKNHKRKLPINKSYLNSNIKVKKE